MDIASIIGVVSGMGFVLGTILLGGSIMMFVNIPSILIVMGGTIAATMVAYPLSDFLGMFKTGIKVFMFKIEKPQDIIANLVEISNKARKGGLLSIEGDIQSTPDPYLAQALQMTVDGVKTADIAAIMQKKDVFDQKRAGHRCRYFFEHGGLCTCLRDDRNPDRSGPDACQPGRSILYRA
jgi:chemotaxis protein MotA